MGVSADNGDLALLVSGGEGFAQRIAELTEAKNSFDKALSDLNLGKAAVAARDEAGRVLSEAKSKRDADMAALDEEVSKARSGLAIWVEDTKATITATLNEASATLSDAKAQQDAVRIANNAAQAAYKNAQDDVAGFLSDAKAQAGEIVAAAQKQAGKIVADANDINAKAKAAMDEALALKVKYDAAMEGIASIQASVA